MAPTEILAAQHFATIKQYLDRLGIESAILIGGQKKNERAQIYSDIEEGKASVVVGTHALIQEKVKFNKLGLIVVDEQHRFGVVQRMTLQEKVDAAKPSPTVEKSAFVGYDCDADSAHAFIDNLWRS